YFVQLRIAKVKQTTTSGIDSTYQPAFAGQTLGKLRQPVPQERQEVPATRWWREVERQFQHDRVRFFAIGMREEGVLPAGLFNSALENLIENALRKQATLPSLAVSVTLDMTDGIVLSVCDTGAPIPPATAKDLFRAPVPSESGLGIGLYQVARQAEWYGYRLQVAANDPGQVCIRLEKQGPRRGRIGRTIPTHGCPRGGEPGNASRSTARRPAADRLRGRRSRQPARPRRASPSCPTGGTPPCCPCL
ncbi:MAG: sensor histidine kinase, partial [Comamonadaceae bacterium]|nr:sensor histidine kinase [Comamonadaceae bacterium]